MSLMNNEWSGGKRLTVIVTAYNVESFIEQSLNSVVSQPGFAASVRLVVVVDGPTDNTGHIVADFVRDHADCDISVLAQSNQGLSAARNEGLRLTTTEYVTFLDGDDFWLPDYLEHVLPAISISQHDIIEYDALLTDEAGRPYMELGISAGSAPLPATVTKQDFLAVFKAYSWARVYRTRLVRSKAFPVGLRFEDTHTTPWYYDEAGSIFGIGRPLFGYRQRRHSIVASPTIEDVASLNLAARHALEKYRASGDEYWTGIAMRAFQQACARIIELPIPLWGKAVSLARHEVASELDPARAPVRILQVRHTWLYVLCLYLKRRTVDRITIQIKKTAIFRKPQ
jgi:glycosyltransferase involved in cell wall biosynthesis